MRLSGKAIEIIDLCFSYPDGEEALKHINLEIEEGEAVGLIGPNGAGKSTLLLHLNGILRAKGRIKILGQELNEKNLFWARSRVGLVFQDPELQLFMPTVFDDVAFGPLNMGMDSERAALAVQGALREVDMLEYIKRVPHHLSYGEKKRISLATVLSMKPEILALDEPSSNLDPGHRRELINLLKGIKATKLVATHDLGMVLELCSRVIMLDRGRLIAQGEARSILKDRQLLEAHKLEVPASFNPLHP